VEARETTLRHDFADTADAMMAQSIISKVRPDVGKTITVARTAMQVCRARVLLAAIDVKSVAIAPRGSTRRHLTGLGERRVASINLSVREQALAAASRAVIRLRKIRLTTQGFRVRYIAVPPVALGNRKVASIDVASSLSAAV